MPTCCHRPQNLFHIPFLCYGWSLLNHRLPMTASITNFSHLGVELCIFIRKQFPVSNWFVYTSCSIEVCRMVHGLSISQNLNLSAVLASITSILYIAVGSDNVTSWILIRLNEQSSSIYNTTTKYLSKERYSMSSQLHS